ncbi:MAG: DUF3343 domain-containing protein [Oscillospiraceae bacterium]|jgi:hypothetical protein|nr:DUF3343 domain-containing protein [Oscillospiraceae bacterium]
MEYLVTFHTHYGAMQFNKLCKAERIAAKLMPVPRELSANCGICVRFTAEVAPKPSEHEDMEYCYAVDERGGYTKKED